MFYLNSFPYSIIIYWHNKKLYKKCKIRIIMLNKKEIGSIIIITIILAFALSLVKSMEIFLYTLLSVFLILIINIIAKKIASYYLESKIDIGLWEIKQYWFKKHWHFKKAFPAGAFFPIILTVLSMGIFTWLACLTFEVKPKAYRVAKKHELYSFSEMTEWHIGLIAAAGIFTTLIFAIIGYFIGLPSAMNFVKLSIFYAFFNMLPFSSLDGNKIFFGNIVLWSFLAILTLIGVAYIFIVI